MMAAQLKETTMDPQEAHAAAGHAGRPTTAARPREIGRAADGHQGRGALRVHPGARGVRQRRGIWIFEVVAHPPVGRLFTDCRGALVGAAAGGGPKGRPHDRRNNTKKPLQGVLKPDILISMPDGEGAQTLKNCGLRDFGNRKRSQGENSMRLHGKWLASTAILTVGLAFAPPPALQAQTGVALMGQVSSPEEGAMEGVLVTRQEDRLDHHRHGGQRRRRATTASRPPSSSPATTR